jgi:hypothetical protein
MLHAVFQTVRPLFPAFKYCLTPSEFVHLLTILTSVNNPMYRPKPVTGMPGQLVITHATRSRTNHVYWGGLYIDVLRPMNACKRRMATKVSMSSINKSTQCRRCIAHHAVLLQHSQSVPHRISSYQQQLVTADACTRCLAVPPWHTSVAHKYPWGNLELPPRSAVRALSAAGNTGNTRRLCVLRNTDCNVHMQPR